MERVDELTRHLIGASGQQTLPISISYQLVIDSYFYEMLVQNGPNHYECADRTI
jgi:hypothetical protein